MVLSFCIVITIGRLRCDLLFYIFGAKGNVNAVFEYHYVSH